MLPHLHALASGRRRRQLLRGWAFSCSCKRCEAEQDDTRDLPCPRCVPRMHDGKLPTQVAIGDVPLQGVLQLHAGRARDGAVGRDGGDGAVGRDGDDGAVGRDGGDGGTRSSGSVAGELEPGAAGVSRYSGSGSSTRGSSSDGGCAHADRHVSTREPEGSLHWRCSACGLRLEYDDDAALFGPLAAVAAAAVAAPVAGAAGALVVGSTRGSSPLPGMGPWRSCATGCTAWSCG